MSSQMEYKAGMIVITQGDPKSIVSWLVKWVTGSWWTHGFVVISATEGIESKFPRVTTLDIATTLAALEAAGRDYLVMDLPGITDDQRKAVADVALSFKGRLYDIWNCIYFAIFKIWKEGGKRLVCSRIMAASFFDGMTKRIFDNAAAVVPESMAYRIPNLEDGYCTPDEVFRYSDLVVIYRRKS